MRVNRGRESVWGLDHIGYEVLAWEALGLPLVTFAVMLPAAKAFHFALHDLPDFDCSLEGKKVYGLFWLGMCW